MIADLKADSLRWAAEVQSDHRGTTPATDPEYPEPDSRWGSNHSQPVSNPQAVPYHNSRTHEHRQQYGPTQAQSQAPPSHASNAQAPIGQPPTTQPGPYDTRSSAAGYYHEGGYSVHPGQGQSYPPAGGYGMPDYQGTSQAYDTSTSSTLIGSVQYSGGPPSAYSTQPRSVSYAYSGPPSGEGLYQSGHDSHGYQHQHPSVVPRGPQSSQQPPRGEPYGRGSYGK
jgi:hypothetical protein